MLKTQTSNNRRNIPLKSWQNILATAKIPRLDAELLAAFVLNKDRPYLLTHPQTTFTPREAARFSRLAARRSLGQPLAYLLGQKEFYGLNFKVATAVLVPRPETELLVDKALTIIHKASGRLSLLDIGTGSGAIAISLAAGLRRQAPGAYRHLSVTAIDISRGALNIARANCRRHRLDKKIRLLQGSLLEPVIKQKTTFDKDLLICANLPYLTPAQIRTSSSIQAEPRLALDGGPDGLKYYRRLFQQLKAQCPAHAVTLLCEIDPSQKISAAKLARRYFPQAEIEVNSDLAKRPRLLIISISPAER